MVREELEPGSSGSHCDAVGIQCPWLASASVQGGWLHSSAPEAGPALPCQATEEPLPQLAVLQQANQLIHTVVSMANNNLL